MLLSTQNKFLLSMTIAIVEDRWHWHSIDYWDRFSWSRQMFLIEEEINIFFTYYSCCCLKSIGEKQLLKNFLFVCFFLFFLIIFQKNSEQNTFRSWKLQLALMFPVSLDCSSADSQIWHEKGVGNGSRTYTALPWNMKNFTCARREDHGKLAEGGSLSGVLRLSCKI